MGKTKYTVEDLKKLQSLDLDQKISLSLTRIVEWYEKYDGSVYISFSGGKDSTVLLHLVRSVYPEVPAVFIDTGLEFPEVRQFVKTFDNVTFLQPPLNFKEVIERYGYPLVSKEIAKKIHSARGKPDGAVAARFNPESSYCKKYNGRYCLDKWTYLKDSDIPISSACCVAMKERPAKKYERESGLKPYIGSMTFESEMRKTNWLKVGCNAFDSPRPNSQPLAFWKEQDILEFLYRNEIPIADIYGEIVEDKNGKLRVTGEKRTGCVFCAFGVQKEKEPNKFQRLKQTHPQLWEYCMKPTDRGGLGCEKC